MALRFVTPAGVSEETVEHLEKLLVREDGFVWLDFPVWTPEVGALLTERFGFHPVALQMCSTPNAMPMVHGYSDHTFFVLHRPMVLAAGDVHMVELDLFVGSHYVVTIQQQQTEEAVTVSPGNMAMSEVDETLARIDAGRIRPSSPIDLLHAIVSLMALRQRLLVQDVALRVGGVERRVLGGAMIDPEKSLEEMFMVRYELLSVRTAAAHGEEVMARTRKLRNDLAAVDDRRLADLQDMFRRVHRMTDSEQEFLAGVIDLYRARTDTKMMIAMERLAVLAAVTLPVTAIASVYGMNVIVNNSTHWVQLIVVLVLMLAISGWLLRWTKKQGWW